MKDAAQRRIFQTTIYTLHLPRFIGGDADVQLKSNSVT